jgi:LysM repeat protein
VPGTIAVTGATCPTINTVGNLDGNLDPNETIDCKFDYVVTQADLDKGSVTNIATATVSGINSNSVTTTISKAPPAVLNLTKTANPVTYNQVGQLITYTYVIMNSGTVTLGPAQFVVTDAGFSAPINCGDATASLAPAATLTCAAIYAITQADMDRGSVATSATASGGGAAASPPASATVTKGTAAVVTPPSNSNLTAGSTVQHKVVAGEWLWQIARCYGADPAKTLQANPQLANPRYISPDMTVSVPNIGSVGRIYGPPCVGTHTVQAGETWASIAQKYNADPFILQTVNANDLSVGRVLKVPLNSAGATLPVAK